VLNKTFSFTKRYLLALTITALLTTLAYFNLNKLISNQADNGKMINISSKQKILAQQIAFYAIYYKIDNLKKIIEPMEKNHNKLLKLPMNQDIKKFFFKEPILLDKRVKEYIKNAKEFSENRSGVSLTYLLRNSSKLVKDLDKVNNLYLKNSNTDTNLLKRVEFYILMLTLTTLFLEAMLIFRPANKAIDKKTKELVEQKNFSNAIIDSSTNAIISLDKDFKIKTFNKSAQKIFGYTKDEIIGKSIFKTLIISNQEIKPNEETNEAEGIDKFNNRFPIRVSFGTGAESKDIFIVANIQDITKEKLKDSVIQQQSKFVALGEMIAIIAHQWRQPLSQLSFNDMYIKKMSNQQEIKDEVDKNEEIIQFMSETISNFENFYTKGEVKEFNPIISINQALSLVDSLLNLNQIELIKEINSKKTIFANSNSLSQVILSILQNSINIIKIRKVKNPYIKIILQDKQDYILLSIEDNAGGIKGVDNINDIFKPFLSPAESHSSGIGLYMSKMIIENKFNGKIEAINTKEGAKFIIKFIREGNLQRH